MCGLESKAIFGNLGPGEGFYTAERDMWGPFIWAQRRFRIKKPRGGNLYRITMCYYGENGMLSIGSEGVTRKEIALYKGWYTYPVDLTGIAENRIEFSLSQVVPVAGDTRELGVMIRRIRPLRDPQVYDSMEEVLLNRVKNDMEYAAGRVILDSYPPKPLISLNNSCNMAPPCVYCNIESEKELENRSDFVFSFRMLSEMGIFYRRAEQIGDSSRGEPLLCKDFDSYLKDFSRQGKIFEVTTNGNLLLKKNRHKFLGKEVTLLVSIDSPTAEGYSRYRDDRFNLVIDNLRELCREKKMSGDLPVVIATFIAMRSNLREIAPFLDLMKEIGVDGVKMRSLHVDPHMKPRPSRRRAPFFDYEKEILGTKELGDLVSSVKNMAREKKVNLIAELDFGAEEAAGEGPICSEPWKSIQILNIGVIPCCFSRRAPLASWSERGDRSLEEFLKDVWNGKAYKEIRAGLANRELPEFCAKFRNCPVVKKKGGNRGG